MNEAYIEFLEVSRYFKVGNTEIKAVDGTSFQIDKGSFTVVVSVHPEQAKQPFLTFLGGMDKADEGRIFVDNQNVSTYNEMRLTTYRRDDIGFVFSYNSLTTSNRTRKCRTRHPDLSECARSHRNPQGSRPRRPAS